MTRAPPATPASTRAPIATAVTFASLGLRTTDDKVVATVPQRGYPDLVVMEPSGRYALVTNRTADQVAVIDLATHKEVRTIPVGRAPHGMALRPR